MNFEELIATLSKGSATAVTALGNNGVQLNGLKEKRMCSSKNGTGSRGHMSDATNPDRHDGAFAILAPRLQTPVNRSLRTEIGSQLRIPGVIFVHCSSGDGRSKLLLGNHADETRTARLQFDVPTGASNKTARSEQEVHKATT